MKNLNTAVSIATMTLALAPAAQALDTNFYGSIRVAAESVQPDKDEALESYTGFRDAFSRVGGVLSSQLTDDLTASIKLELPLDVANGKLQRPDEQEDELRILKAQLSGSFGTLWIGKDWTPFYNNIAYPVDYFSSYYSGWTTTTITRVPDMLAYVSPSLNGFTISGAFAKDHGDDDRSQFTIAHSGEKLTLSAGIDKTGGVNNTKVLGAAIGYTEGNWYLAAKTEQFSSDKESDGYGQDGTGVVSAIVQYSQGANTFRALVSQFDNYGESIFHAGWDHQYQPNLKFFVEYYQEEETAVIAEERKSTLNVWNDSSGGQVVTAGVRFDF